LNQSCEDNPIDVSTPITGDLTLVQVIYDDSEPCLQLSSIRTSGEASEPGALLSVTITPANADVSVRWQTSSDEFNFTDIPGENGLSYLVKETDESQTIKVVVSSASNPPLALEEIFSVSAFTPVSTCIDISTVEELSNISSTQDECYELGNDIDLLGLTFGRSVKPGNFSGVLDGKGYNISNLTINNPSDEVYGLFNVLQNATIRNLQLDNFDINGGVFV
jgi:hypothetical protein